MQEQIIANLLAWFQANFMQINGTNNKQIFDIPNFGKAYLVLSVNGKILDQEMMFLFDEENAEQQELEKLVEQKEVDYLIFEFGKLFYYAKPIFKKDSYNEMRFVVDFQDLKYLGKNTLESDIIVNHIGIHTEYDLLNGNGLKNYIKKAKHFGCTHLGMCDKNTLAGTLAWQVEIQKLGLKSILGETIDVATDYDPNEPAKIPITYELKLYCTSWQGWQNLLQINKCINVDYPKFIPEQELQKYQQGLICIAGPQSYLNFKNKKEVVKWLAKFKGFKNRYFQVDCSEFYSPGDDLKRLDTINDYLKGDYLQLLPPILVQDIYYCDKEMYIVKDYLNKVAKRAYDYSEDQYFKSFDEVNVQMQPLFQDKEKYLQLMGLMLENLNDVCEGCGSFEIETGTRLLPIYENDLQLSSEELFMQIVLQGFQERIMIDRTKNSEIYLKRLEIELDTIKEGNLENYFLILWDILKWCRENDISVGPGRGSVAGSLVAFCCHITDVDPITHDLLFSRFLNKTRILPEIKYKIEYDDGTSEILDEQHFKELKYFGEIEG